MNLRKHPLDLKVGHNYLSWKINLETFEIIGRLTHLHNNTIQVNTKPYKMVSLIMEKRLSKSLNHKGRFKLTELECLAFSDMWETLTFHYATGYFKNLFLVKTMVDDVNKYLGEKDRTEQLMRKQNLRIHQSQEDDDI